MWNPLQEADASAGAGRRTRWLCVGALGLTCGLLLLGFLFGWFIKSSNEATNNVPQYGMKKAFLNELKAENIKAFL